MSRTLTDTVCMLGGALAGAAAMYFLDPESGDRRRADIKGQALSAADHATAGLGTAWDSVSGTTEHLKNRGQEVVADLGRKLSEWGSQASHHAHGVSDSVASGVSSSANALSDQSRYWVNRARSMAGYPEQKSHAGAYTAAGVGTLVVGAGLMYLLDPHRGRGRRAKITDNASRLFRHTGNTFRTVGRDIARQTRKIVGANQPGGDSYRMEDSVSADVLLHRIRDELRDSGVANAANVQLMTDNSGVVTVHGNLPASDVDPTLNVIRRVSGVSEVVNLLTRNEAGSPTTATSAAAAI